VCGRDYEHQVTDLIAIRAKGLDLRGINAVDGAAVEWISIQDNALHIIVSISILKSGDSHRVKIEHQPTPIFAFACALALPPPLCIIIAP